MTPDEYLVQAALARQQAAKASDQDTRAAWLAIAENYETLARISEIEKRRL